MFSEKTLLITGGTGSFGNAVLNRFLDTNIGEIRIFSRDEKKQDDMRNSTEMTVLNFILVMLEIQVVFVTPCMMWIISSMQRL